MRFPRDFSLVAMVLLVALAACTSKQNPQDLKEKTAQATAELKVDAKAVAAGIREGWSRDKPLDVNAATREQLITLPGVSGPDANNSHRGASLRHSGPTRHASRPDPEQVRQDCGPADRQEMTRAR